MRRIDLNGPEGNAWVLLGFARRWCKELGWDYAPIQADMKSGDYDHLVEVFQKHFGGFVKIVKIKQRQLGKRPVRQAG